jgi:elongation factor Tu
VTEEGGERGDGPGLYMISVGPSAGSLSLLSSLLSRRFGEPLEPEEDPRSTSAASGQLPRLYPNQRSYSVYGTRVGHYDLPAASFPGAALACGDGDWVWVVVLPFDLLCGQATATLLRLLRALGERPLALVIDDPRSPDPEPELRALARGELQEQLASAGFSAGTPIVWGSLREALAEAEEGMGPSATAGLLTPLSRWIGASADGPRRDRRTEPFFMPIEDRFNMPGHQLVVTGRIERGTVRVGDTLVLRGSTSTQGRVAGVEMFRRRLEEAFAGDVVGLLLDDTRFAEVDRGDLLTAAETPVDRRRRVRAVVYLKDRAACGYQGSFAAAVFVVHLRTASHRARMRLAPDHPWGWDRELAHDRTVVVDLELEEPCWYQPGARFALRVEGIGAGFGVFLADP